MNYYNIIIKILYSLYYIMDQEQTPSILNTILNENVWANNGLLGDLNNDQILNILDIVQLVNIVLLNNYDSNGDLNNDGFINILDIVQLINIILN